MHVLLFLPTKYANLLRSHCRSLSSLLYLDRTAAVTRLTRYCLCNLVQGRVAVENEYALGIVAHENRADTDFLQTAMENTEDNEHKECAKPVIGLAKGSFVIDSMFSFHWKQIQDTLGQLERARYEDDIDKMKPLMELLKHWKDAGDRIMGKRNELDSMVKSCAEEGEFLGVETGRKKIKEQFL